MYVAFSPVVHLEEYAPLLNYFVHLLQENIALMADVLANPFKLFYSYLVAFLLVDMPELSHVLLSNGWFVCFFRYGFLSFIIGCFSKKWLLLLFFVCL